MYQKLWTIFRFRNSVTTFSTKLHGGDAYSHFSTGGAYHMPNTELKVVDMPMGTGKTTGMIHFMNTFSDR